jgi:hypothetical protein
MNEVRQSVITHEITDSKVLSHKKAHKDAQEGKGKPERIMNIMYYSKVSLFKLALANIQRKKGSKRGNLVRRLEWWTHRIMINSAFKKENLYYSLFQNESENDTMRGIIKRGRKSKAFNLKKRSEKSSNWIPTLLSVIVVMAQAIFILSPASC